MYYYTAYLDFLTILIAYGPQYSITKLMSTISYLGFISEVWKH